MALPKNKNARKALTEELIAVAHSDDFQLAKDYLMLLQEYSIPAKIEDRSEEDIEFGTAIVVPESFFDEAHMIIESQQTNNSFYDFFFDDAVLDDFDSFEENYD